MPVLERMQWEKTKQRWRKMYQGKIYTVAPSSLDGTNRDDTRSAANEWWERKKHELDTPALSPIATQLAAILESRTLENLSALAARGESAAIAVQAVLGLQKVNDKQITAEGIKSGEIAIPGIYHLGITPEKTGRLVRTIESKTSLSHHVREWCELQIASEKNVQRKVMNCNLLKAFRDFVGADEDVTAITEDTFQNYFLHLNKQDFGNDYKKRHMMIAKNFVKYLWEKRLIDLPRNLSSPLLTFKISSKAIKIPSVEMVRQFYSKATGQLPLHILLMLNCGMYAQDISDMKEEEIDWKEGTIERKRSKRKDDPHAPIVKYKLWSKTLKLLKFWRSGEERVLQTKSGKAWIQQGLNPGDKVKHSDSISTNFKWLAKKTGIKVSPKDLRKVSATLLQKHPLYKTYAQYFLAHAPETTADRHYVIPNEAEFFAALLWLEKELGLGE